MVDFKIRMPAGNKPQRISEMIVVLTNLPADKDTLKIPVRGEIVGRIRVYPEFAVLPVIAPGEETVKDVTLTSNEGTFHVLSAEVPNSPVEIEIVPQKEGRQTLLRLRYVGEEAGTNGVRTLRIQTDDESQGLIELPVRYQTRSVTAQAGGKKS
jgi:hypothetical protein